MSQTYSQTKIDQFYNVVYNKNNRYGLQKSIKSSQNQPCNNNIRRKLNLLENCSKKCNFVESEVQIIAMKTPTKSSNLKRTSSLHPDSSPKKFKLDNQVENGIIPLNKCQLASFKKSSMSPESPKKHNSFTPKKSPEKKSMLNDNKPLSPRKLFFADRIDIQILTQAIESLNLYRQNSISLNEFDLESIYRSKEFSFIYSDNITQNTEKFLIEDIIFAKEKYADHFLMVVMDVFANPVNCGYFLRKELDLIFSMFTLSPEAQMLFVRLLKRKLSWHRSRHLKYPEIADNLDPFCQELAKNGFCNTDLELIDITILLDMLLLDEVRSICQKLKIDHHGNKPILIERLSKYGSTSKSYFFGAKSPKSILRSATLQILQPCICLPQDIIDLFNRVLTLLHPVQDPAESFADLFLTLTNVHKGELLYPLVPKEQFFPIFKNRSHLINYTRSRNALREVFACIEKKEWNKLKDLGRLALEYISNKDNSHITMELPLHIKKFMPEYIWLKVLSKTIDAFKKSPETISEAINGLKILISEKTLLQSSCGRWYNELALIEMHHKKDLETSAELTLHALRQETLSEVDISGLIERLRKLMRRKNGLCKETKTEIQQALENLESRGLLTVTIKTKNIMANMANRVNSSRKSTWSININGNDKFYGSVEILALQHYTSEEHFHEGLHCEGSLPVILFTTLFWDELYNIFVPGAFVSHYQDAPLDLFTADFFPNRKKALEKKIEFFKQLDLESFSDLMNERFLSYNKYQSIMSTSLFKNEKQFKEVVTCLGIEGVIGICEKLASNFVLWRSGFPDLIVWNKLIQKCKIIEVKGPGDILSEKQKLWLQYLQKIGIDVEVCHVQAFARGSK
ncbi:fanconi-associated nuclease 1-like isoform X2 [Phymastichus coffea]|uniref:fanconi-associated nuclease 1-like isoform X2 n=1 Tax=Phymastichus coffea TaxID=108790 RepID=UPI00273B02AB|nr:fanconi-associated nuclease 1-like isoform X2 [Phymastichus coffea]